MNAYNRQLSYEAHMARRYLRTINKIKQGKTQ